MDKYQLTVINGTLVKQGQDLENRAAHPHPTHPRIPWITPPPPVCDSPDCLQDETNYLNNVFSKNNYNKDFVRRNTHSNTDSNTHTSVNSGPVTKASIPYIRGTSETIARILQPYNIRVAHRPITTLRRLVLMSRTTTNRRTDREQYTRSNAATARLPTLVKPAETLARDWPNTNDRDKKWWRQQSHCWTLFTDETGIKSTGILRHVLRILQTTITTTSWFTNLEQTPLNHSQQLSAPYKRLIDEIKQN